MKTFFERICISLSRLVPPFYKTSFERIVRYSGKEADISVSLGFSMVNALTIFGIVYLFIYLLNFSPGWLINLAGFFVIVLLVFFSQYIYYYFLAERRSKFVDRILPDALSLIASNLASGLTPYHAVKSSIRPDFGPLGEAFEIATNKSLGTKSFNKSLLEMTETINSDPLNRSMKLFSSAIESGSNISALLESLAADITDRRILKNDLVTSTKTNSMFILFMVIVGAPFLMAVSIFFVDIVGDIQENSGLDAAASAEFDIGFGGQIGITPEFLRIYAYVLLFITGLLASYFSATMIEGDGKSGLRIAPAIIGGSFIVFVISSFLINNVLGGLF
jgi:Flp pilus assembly protein TadB